MATTIRRTENFQREKGTTAQFPVSAREGTNKRGRDRTHKVMSMFRRVNPMLIHPPVMKRSNGGDSITLRGNTFKPQRGFFFFLTLNQLLKLVAVA